VLSHIDEIKGFEYVYKPVSYSTRYQLVLGWNLIWAYVHDSLLKANQYKNLTINMTAYQLISHMVMYYCIYNAIELQILFLTNLRGNNSFIM